MRNKKTNPKNNIIPQMHDVRPVKKTGDLDWEKIVGAKKSGSEMPATKRPEEIFAPKLSIRKEPTMSRTDRERGEFKAKVLQLGQAYESASIPMYYQSSYQKHAADNPRKFEDDFDRAELPAFNFKKTVFSFAALVVAVAALIGGVSFLGKGLEIKKRVLGESDQAYGNILAAMQNAGEQKFQNSAGDFNAAYQNFSEGSAEISKLGDILVDATRFVPFASKLSSGKNALEAGKHLSLAGESLSGVVEILSVVENPLASEREQDVSLLEIFRKTEDKLRHALTELKQAEEYLERVKVDDLPKDKQEQFVVLKKKLSTVTDSIARFLDNSHIFSDLLGGNGPRKYLFLFQNNQEMRATGGFIGSYGLLDIANGKIKKFFVDGIFNPDGQLWEKIVPPEPIQKISAAWSMHDSNWFPDFPVSAEKAISFYEKTGGPTADGIITLTPTVMEKLLEITGPIEMAEYGVTLDAQNFVEQTQYEVEIDYDRAENKPKKILSDLAPIILNKVFNARDFKSVSRTLGVIAEALNQKHILLYSQDAELQKMIAAYGWSGEILETPKDYLSVINTNINGFKTDGVIEETIEHAAEIQGDGSIVDTVTITRSHQGGQTGFDWWNGVNANYMRVYVPQGATLLEAEGQTREVVESPLDYDGLGFKRDPQVQEEEERIEIHEQSGTRVYIDAGKTVFANWIYVSPQEKVVVKYKYLLPFKLSFSQDNPSDAYALLAQKQAGSIGSVLMSKVIYPDNWETKWTYPAEATRAATSLELISRLEVDRFIGIVFTPK